MSGEWWLVAAIGLAAAILVGLRERIEAALRRFDSEMIRRREAEAEARSDPLAHLRATIHEIDARVAPVEMADDSASRFRVATWNGERFASVEDASHARVTAILEEARAFYQEIDRLQVERILEARARARMGRG